MTTSSIIHRSGNRMIAALGLACLLGGLQTGASAATIAVGNCNDSGSGSLRAAIAAAGNADTIDLSSLTCDTIVLASALVVAQGSLTIQGKPTTDSDGFPVSRVNGTDNHQIFRHTGSGTLLIKNLGLWQGKVQTSAATAEGGCIASEGTISMSESVLNFCQAESTSGVAEGGALRAAGNVVVVDSQILNSQATGGGGAMGGGIFSGGNISLTNSSLNKNSAAAGSGQAVLGGGAYTLNGRIQVTASQINNNEAVGPEGRGGGLHGASVYNTVTLDNPGESTLMENKAGSGGAIYFSSLGRLTGVTMKQNSSTSGAGGAILGAGALKLKSSELNNNYATTDGGGVALSGDADSEITGSMVSNNKAGDNGGGVHLSGAGLLALEDTTLLNNRAEGSGGGLSVPGDVELIDSTVQFNKASFAAGMDIMRNARIERSMIAYNTAEDVGAAALGSHASTKIQIFQSTIIGNRATATVYGSGLVLYGNNVTQIKNSTIVSNWETRAIGVTQTHGAGIALANGSSLHLSSTIVSLNPSVDSDGQNRISSDIGFSGIFNPASFELIGSNNLLGEGAAIASGLLVPADTIRTNQPGLGFPEDNGGPTQTCLPKEDSPALDQGIDNGFTTDQRGEGFARVFGVAADIGAAERQPIALGPDIFSDGFED